MYQPWPSADEIAWALADPTRKDAFDAQFGWGAYARELAFRQWTMRMTARQPSESAAHVSAGATRANMPDIYALRGRAAALWQETLEKARR